MAAFLIVRAQIQDPKRSLIFRSLVRKRTSPRCVGCLYAQAAWRSWSEVESQVHYGFYEFENLANAQAISNSDTIKALN